jgi:hypothetical protein
MELAPINLLYEWIANRIGSCLLRGHADGCKRRFRRCSWRDSLCSVLYSDSGRTWVGRKRVKPAGLDQDHTPKDTLYPVSRTQRCFDLSPGQAVALSRKGTALVQESFQFRIRLMMCIMTGLTGCPLALAQVKVDISVRIDRPQTAGKRLANGCPNRFFGFDPAGMVPSRIAGAGAGVPKTHETRVGRVGVEAVREAVRMAVRYMAVRIAGTGSWLEVKWLPSWLPQVSQDPVTSHQSVRPTCTAYIGRPEYDTHRKLIVRSTRAFLCYPVIHRKLDYIRKFDLEIMASKRSHFATT